MKKRKFLITAGPTREYMDPVRFISNASSGKMGYLIAEEALKKGNIVTLISGPTCLKPPLKTRVISIISAEDMHKEVRKCFPECDVFISCAAVSDYKPLRFEKSKIKKSSQVMTIKLAPTSDILKSATESKTKKGKIIVGFALETENIIKNARKKLYEKSLDIVIANPSESMESDKSEAAVILKNGEIIKLKKSPKKIIAKKILKIISDYADGKID